MDCILSIIICYLCIKPPSFEVRQFREGDKACKSDVSSLFISKLYAIYFVATPWKYERNESVILRNQIVFFWHENVFFEGHEDILLEISHSKSEVSLRNSATHSTEIGTTCLSVNSIVRSLNKILLYCIFRI